MLSDHRARHPGRDPGGGVRRRRARPARRSKHDAIRSQRHDDEPRRDRRRHQPRAGSSASRPSTCPQSPRTRCSSLPASKIADYLGLDRKKEKVLALRLARRRRMPIALGTRAGCRQASRPRRLPEPPDFEVIALKPGDEVVGARQGADDGGTGVRHLRCAAAALPRRVRAPAGPSGGRHGRHQARPPAMSAIFFTVSPTRRRPSWPRSRPTRRRSPAPTPVGRRYPASTEFPGKGRATGGVRAHAFLKGEDSLALAWVGPEPALAVGTDGAVRQLPEAGREAGCLRARHWMP